MDITKLRKALHAALGNPLIHSLGDKVWEHVFAYSKGIKFSANQGKSLFDVIDTSKRIGWSCKASQGLPATGKHFDVVVYRWAGAGILGKRLDALKTEQDAAAIGSIVLEKWNTKIEGDCQLQCVKTKKMAFLLSDDKNNFSAFDGDFDTYSDIQWTWTDENRSGLRGMQNGETIFKWYPRGGQLFQRFFVPETAHTFSMSVDKLDLDELITLYPKSNFMLQEELPPLFPEPPALRYPR